MQDRAADAKLFADLLEAYAGLIAIDEVVFVSEMDWADHVFDFTTDNGLILAGGVVVSNCRCRIVGARGPASIRRMGGDPDKPLPEWVGKPNPKTGAPVGIDRGFAYQPGATVADAVRALVPKLDRLPPAPSIAVIQDCLRMLAFAAWYAAPRGVWPLARLPDADAQAIGAGDDARVAVLSEETARQQQSEHPELSAGDYAQAQDVIDRHTAKAVEGGSLIYVREMLSEDGGGYVMVVKATRTRKALYVTSVRRLSRQQAERDGEIRRLLIRKGKDE